MPPSSRCVRSWWACPDLSRTQLRGRSRGKTPMRKNKEFNEILDKCLERLRQGASIEQCLADHPGQGGELRPLLETGAMGKQATGAVQLRLASSDVDKAEVYARLADVRMKELDYLKDKHDRPEKAEEVRRELNVSLEKVVVLAAPPPKPAVLMSPAPRRTNGDRNEGTAPSVVPAAPGMTRDALTRATPSVTPAPPAAPPGLEVRRAQLAERLKEFVARREALLKALENAPNEKAKLAIMQAIKVTERGYGLTLEQLQKLDAGNGVPKPTTTLKPAPTSKPALKPAPPPKLTPTPTPKPTLRPSSPPTRTPSAPPLPRPSPRTA